MLAAVFFITLSLLMCVACVLAVLAIAQVEMGGSQAIKRDGMRPGARAPGWTLTDAAGTAYTSPPQRPLQLVVFAGHSLRSFPSVVEGLQKLKAQATELEIVVLLRHPNEIAQPMLEVLGLGSVPVLTGTPSLYARYNVRVSPWLIFVDSRGRVRASSLVNEDWQVGRLYQLASLPLDSEDAQAGSRSGHRTSGIEV
jgi:hypothetical protein